MLDPDMIVPCAFCNKELSDEKIDKLNELYKKHTSVRPCCGEPLCLRRSVEHTTRNDGFITKGGNLECFCCIVKENGVLSTCTLNSQLQNNLLFFF